MASFGGQVAEPDPGRDGSRGVLSCGEFPVGGLDPARSGR
jgi:hypothetical protein